MRSTTSSPFARRAGPSRCIIFGAGKIDLHGAAAGRNAKQGPLADAGAQRGAGGHRLIFPRFLRGAFRGASPYERAAGNFDDEVLAGMAVHAIAHAESAVLRDEARLIILGDEIVQVVVGFEDHVAAAPAVAAAGSALRTILLALEGDAPFAAVAGPRVDLDLVNEHKKRRGRRLAAKGCPGGSTGGRGRFRHHVDAVAILVESDFAIHQGEQCPVAPGADVLAGDELGPALADEDAAGGDRFARRIV